MKLNGSFHFSFPAYRTDRKTSLNVPPDLSGEWPLGRAPLAAMALPMAATPSRPWGGGGGGGRAGGGRWGERIFGREGRSNWAQRGSSASKRLKIHFRRETQKENEEGKDCRLRRAPRPRPKTMFLLPRMHRPTTTLWANQPGTGQTLRTKRSKAHLGTP